MQIKTIEDFTFFYQEIGDTVVRQNIAGWTPSAQKHECQVINNENIRGVSRTAIQVEQLENQKSKTLISNKSQRIEGAQTNEKTFQNVITSNQMMNAQNSPNHYASSYIKHHQQSTDATKLTQMQEGNNDLQRQELQMCIVEMKGGALKDSTNIKFLPHAIGKTQMNSIDRYYQRTNNPFNGVSESCNKLLHNLSECHNNVTDQSIISMIPIEEQGERLHLDCNQHANHKDLEEKELKMKCDSQQNFQNHKRATIQMLKLQESSNLSKSRSQNERGLGFSNESDIISTIPNQAKMSDKNSSSQVEDHHQIHDPSSQKSNQQNLTHLATAFTQGIIQLKNPWSLNDQSPVIGHSKRKFKGGFDWTSRNQLDHAITASNGPKPIALLLSDDPTLKDDMLKSNVQQHSASSSKQTLQSSAKIMAGIQNQDFSLMQSPSFQVHHNEGFEMKEKRNFQGQGEQTKFHQIATERSPRYERSSLDIERQQQMQDSQESPRINDANQTLKRKRDQIDNENLNFQLAGGQPLNPYFDQGLYNRFDHKYLSQAQTVGNLPTVMPGYNPALQIPGQYQPSFGFGSIPLSSSQNFYFPNHFPSPYSIPKLRSSVINLPHSRTPDFSVPLSPPPLPSSTKRRKLDQEHQSQHHFFTSEQNGVMNGDVDANSNEFLRDHALLKTSHLKTQNQQSAKFEPLLDTPKDLRMSIAKKEVRQVTLTSTQVDQVLEKFNLKGFIDQSLKHWYAVHLSKGFKLCTCTSCQQLEHPVLIKSHRNPKEYESLHKVYLEMHLQGQDQNLKGSKNWLPFNAAKIFSVSQSNQEQHRFSSNDVQMEQSTSDDKNQHKNLNSKFVSSFADLNTDQSAKIDNISENKLQKVNNTRVTFI